MIVDRTRSLISFSFVIFVSYLIGVPRTRFYGYVGEIKAPELARMLNISYVIFF